MIEYRLYRLPKKSVRWKKMSIRRTIRWPMEICEEVILDKNFLCEECSDLLQRQSSILSSLPELPGDTRHEGIIHTQREKSTEAVLRCVFSYFCTWVVLFSFLQYIIKPIRMTRKTHFPFFLIQKDSFRSGGTLLSNYKQNNVAGKSISSILPFFVTENLEIHLKEKPAGVRLSLWALNYSKQV